jgi:hypothetical protein
MSNTESCEEEMSYEELAMSYHDLMAKNSELTQKLEEQAREIAQLQDERFDNLAHISELNDELSRLNLQLNQIDEQTRMKSAESMFKHSEEHPTKKKSKIWVCDHCREKGHIRPYCFKLKGEFKYFQQNLSRNGWNHRNTKAGLIAHTSLRASSKEDWYFDSGCSRHMTGVETYLDDVRPYVTSYVTFGDGAKGKIVGIGNLI